MHGLSLTKEESFQMPLANPWHHDGRHTGLLPPQESPLKHKDLHETNKQVLIYCSYKNTPNFSSWQTGLLVSAFAFFDF